jgi:hypothetical protein
MTIENVQEFTLLVARHPEWQAELRRLVLTDQLLALPDTVRELAEAQNRTEQRLEALAEAQQRTEAGLARLEGTVAELVTWQQRTEQRLEALVEAQQRTEQRLEALAEALQQTQVELADVVAVQNKLVNQVARLNGRELERTYRERARSVFGRWLRPVRLVEPDDLRDVLEQNLLEIEVDSVMNLDLLMRGSVRSLEERPELWLAVEISMTIDRSDVERALQRAQLLRRAGYPAMAVVAGESLTSGTAEILKTTPVFCLRDGQASGWEEALAAALGPAPGGAR